MKDQAWLKILCLNLWGDGCIFCCGTKVHNILMILRIVRPLRKTASAARHQMARTNSQSQGCSTHVAAWLRRELKTAAFVAGMKGSMQNNSRSINAPFCSPSWWSVQWQICSICSSAASDCHGRLHGHIFQTQFCNFILLCLFFVIFFCYIWMVGSLRCATTGILSYCSTPGKWHGQITNVSRLPQKKGV